MQPKERKGADRRRIQSPKRAQGVPFESEKESTHDKKERKRTGVMVPFPWRAKSLGHYEVAIALSVAPSKIPHAGDGCFALQHIPGPDFLVGFYGGPRARLLAEDDFQAMIAPEQQKCIPLYLSANETIWVWPETDPAAHKHPTYLINHRSSLGASEVAKRTNVAITPEGAIVTTRLIMAGEELYLDYGLGYWVDHLLIQQLGKHVDEEQFKMLYRAGFPTQPARMIWEAIDTFYSNAEPGFELLQTHQCTHDEFQLVMDYLFDTYVVVQKTHPVIDKLAVLSIPRYGQITAMMPIQEMENKLGVTVLKKPSEQLAKLEARVVKLLNHKDAEMRVAAEDPQKQRKLVLVREAFRSDIVKHFFVAHGFKEADAREWIRTYNWHGIPDMTFAKVFMLAHKPEKNGRGLLISHLTGNWSSTLPFEQPRPVDVRSLQLCAPPVVANVLQTGRGTAIGSSLASIPLFPYNLNLNASSDGVPGQPRMSVSQQTSSSSSKLAAEQEEQTITAQLTQEFKNELHAGSLQPSDEPDPRKVMKERRAFVRPEEWLDFLGVQETPQEESDKPVPDSADDPEPADLEAAAAAVAAAVEAEAPPKAEYASGEQAASAVRAFAPAAVMRAISGPVPRPSSKALLVNALYDWKFKLYQS